MSSNHKHHSHHDHGEHHEHHSHMVMDFKKRFYISLILTIPILILSPMIQSFIGVDIRFSNDQYILFVLSTFIFFYGGRPFLTGAIDELKDKNPGMMTLIGFAIFIAYGYSALTVFGWQGNDFFWELATLIDIMLLGHWIEMKSVMGASNALEQLIKLIPSEAHKLHKNGDITDIPVSELKKNDTILIKPGEKVPIDGVILNGETTIDESMLTGESIPVEKYKEDEVIGGSINNEGSLTVQVKHTEDDSYLSQVINLVKEAQNSQSKTQNITDKAAKWLFYIAVVSGLITLFIWLILGYAFDTSLERMVTVMVITCPHALGLAAPLVTAVSTSISAKNGLLIRNRTNFENARNVNTVIFDKTGTLTKGEFRVTDIDAFGDYREKDILTWAASVEQHSEHPIAKGIIEAAREQNLSIKEVSNFDSITGQGITGTVDNQTIHIVSPGYIEKQQINFDKINYEKRAKEGKTVVFILNGDKLAGMIAVADMVRDTAKKAIQHLHQKNIHSVMLTGDNKEVANWVASQLDIDEIFAEVLPDEKANKVKEIKDKSGKTAMTGDGVNDAPALATADVGIAIGAGTDIAIESADIVLVNSNPNDVVTLIDLSKKTYSKMVQNLWWASGYNIIAIPLAAGILAPVGIVLSPAVGAILMSLSTIIVAFNAKLLKI